MTGSSKKYPVKIALYVWFMTLIGAVVLVWTYHYPKALDPVTFVFFAILAILAELLPVELPGGFAVSVGFAVNFASIVILGPFGGALVGGVSMLVGELVRARKLCLPVMFNCSQIVIASGLAGLAFIGLGGAPRLASGVGEIWPAFFGLTVAYFLVNTVGVTGIISLQQELSFWRVWINSMRDLMKNFLALAPLGLLIAVLYAGPLGIFGVCLLVIPLYLARYSFQQYALIKDAHFDTIKALAAALDAKDTYTRGHSDRVAGLAVKIAREMDLSEERVERVRYAGLLHDIGKIGVHDNILNKIGRLDDEDFRHIQEHPVIGANMVSQVKFLQDVARIIRHHHEWFDGHGYPDGFKGDEIPLESRIMAVADAFDAMTSDRVYRRGMTVPQAVEQIRLNRGVQFDPDVVRAFLRLVEKGDEAVVG